MRKEKKTKHEERWEGESERGFASAEDIAPAAFVEWWKGHDHCPQLCTSRDGLRGYSGGISAHKAWQCACYRLEFKERGHEYAAGTGVNYAYYGWHRAEDPPRTSSSAIFEAHREWCRRHGRPDPARPSEMPVMLKEVKSFDDAKTILDVLADKMNMNKAIGWTKADSKLLLEDAP